MSGRIYSVGYEGFDAASLIERLASAKVSVLVDVRLNAVSRKQGFSKKALAGLCEQAGIEYHHERELGNPKENRDSFRNGDGVEGRRRMREMLENGSGAALQRLIDLATDSRVAVLCVERERHRCHRDVITEMVEELDPEIEVLQVV